MNEFKQKTLDRYKKEYDRLPSQIKQRQASWETIRTKLLEKDFKKLKLASAMQGEGQLFGIDQQGKVLFKDRGTEPVMYGLDEAGQLLVVYDHQPEQLQKIVEFLEYDQIHEAVLKGSYEMFPVNEDHSFSDEIKQAMAETGKPFVASENGVEWRISYVETPIYSPAPLYIGFDPYNGLNLFAYLEDKVMMYDDPGVMRLLRV